MQALFIALYFLVGVVQLFAIVEGIKFAVGISGILAGAAALFITPIPFLGAAAGVYGAYHGWHWELWTAAGLFFWYVPVLLIASVFGNNKT